MQSFRRTVGLAGLALTFALVAIAAGSGQHQSKRHEHPVAQKLKNPVASTPESIAAAKKLYGELCEQCHGESGKGDGMMAEDLKVKPADLTDETWVHGSTDGEIFVLIRDGSPDGMEKFGKRLTARQIWHLVNYVRTLGPKPTY